MKGLLCQADAPPFEVVPEDTSDDVDFVKWRQSGKKWWKFKVRMMQMRAVSVRSLRWSACYVLCALVVQVSHQGFVQWSAVPVLQGMSSRPGHCMGPRS